MDINMHALDSVIVCETCNPDRRLYEIWVVPHPANHEVREFDIRRIDTTYPTAMPTLCQVCRAALRRKGV